MRFRSIFAQRMPEADLNSESAKAATHYIQERQKDAPLAEKTAMLNYVAHGFYMGFRHCEEQFGVKGDNNGRKNPN